MTSKSKTNSLLPAPLRDEFGQAVLDWLQAMLPLYSASKIRSETQLPPAFQWDRGARIYLQPAAPSDMLSRFKTTPAARKQIYAFGRRLLELSTRQHQRTLREMQEQEGLR